MGLINDESVGSYGQENIYVMELIKKLEGKNFCYFDLVYEDTEAIKYVAEKGISHINGKLMLLNQAKESFFLWTGKIMS